MAGYTLSALEADIRSYCEVDSNVFNGAILGRFIGNVENKMHLSRITHHINSVFQARRIVTIINYKNQLVE